MPLWKKKYANPSTNWKSPNSITHFPWFAPSLECEFHFLIFVMVSFYVPIWMLTRCPDYTLFLICLGGCPWIKWASEAVDSIKYVTLPNVNKQHPTCWRPEQNKRQRKEEFALFTIFPASLLLKVEHLISSPPALGLELTPLAPLQTGTEWHHWSSVCREQTGTSWLP